MLSGMGSIEEDEVEIELPGGRTRGRVVRIGNRVHRRRRPEAATIHALLDHLGMQGFEGAPRPLGFDDNGREVLSCIEGTVGVFLGTASVPDYVRSDESLAAVGRLVRRYRDATVSFVPPQNAVWVAQVGHPVGGEVVCHNDIGPYNTVFRGGAPVALIDFDDAAPGPREWDLAYAAYRFVPFYPDEICLLPVNGWKEPPDRQMRLEILCDSYGWGDESKLLTVLVRRIDAMMATGLDRHRRGSNLYGDDWHETVLPRLRRDRDFVATLA